MLPCLPCEHDFIAVRRIFPKTLESSRLLGARFWSGCSAATRNTAERTIVAVLVAVGANFNKAVAVSSALVLGFQVMFVQPLAKPATVGAFAAFHNQKF